MRFVRRASMSIFGVMILAGCASNADRLISTAPSEEMRETVRPMVAGDAMGLQIYQRQREIAAAKDESSDSKLTVLPED